jgi:ribose/xylose/arabinose/galactoside ABC-type transport system permease subunit
VLKRLLGSSEAGLVLIILVLGFVLKLFGGSHADIRTGHQVSNFLNPDTLLGIATNASFFAIMAVGMTAVIVSGGIDLSIGSIYALCGVSMALILRALNAHHAPAGELLVVALVVCVGIGLLAGFINGAAIRALDVHPFIITLGTLWVFRGIAFVISKAESILLPQPVVDFAKAGLGMSKGLHPVPLIAMVLAAIAGSVFLSKTAAGRRVFAVGGNLEASRYAGLPINRVLIGVYVLTGLGGGIAAFLGNAYYGSASCGDASGYELYVIASAVVGGASLSGGRGSALGAVLGAILIQMIQESIQILHLDTNYEQIIVGLAIVIAVVLDRVGARMRARRLLAARAESGG